MECLVCKRSNILDQDIKLIEEECAKTSGKLLKSVLRHILKCTQIDLEIDESSCLCSKCYIFLMEYDEQVVKLMTLQQRFKIMYQNPVNLSKTTTLQMPMKYKTRARQSEPAYEEIISDRYKPEMSTDDEMDVSEKEEAGDTGEASDSANSVKPIVILADVPRIQCQYCAQSFKNRGSLRRHISEEHVRKESTCTICGISVKDEEYLELHMNLHEGKTEYDCRYCSKRFTHKSSVIRHMHKHWDKKKYQCEKCGLRFSETPRLYNHKLLHEAEENPLICHICNQNCKTRRTYKRHMNTHSEDRPRYPCHICGKTFSEKFTLKPHLRTHEEYVEKTNKRSPITTTTVTEIVEAHTCVICGGTFVDKEVFNKHMQNEHDVIIWDG